jgi:hypothetical protein
MRHKIRSRLTYANVMATVAVFLALGGAGAYATHETIFSDDIVDGEVKTVDLGTTAVTNAKLGNNSVRTGKVVDNNLLGADLLDGTVATADLANGAVTPAKFGATPAARVQKTGNQTIPHNTGSIALSFDQEDFDTANLHDNTTNNSRLTAPINGVYQVSAGVAWASNTVGTRVLDIVVNGPAGNDYAASYIPATGISPRQSTSALVKLTAGQFVVAVAYQNSGSSVDTQPAKSTFLAMTWVGTG